MQDTARNSGQPVNAKEPSSWFQVTNFELSIQWIFTTIAMISVTIDSLQRARQPAPRKHGCNQSQARWNQLNLTLSSKHVVHKEQCWINTVVIKVTNPSMDNLTATEESQLRPIIPNFLSKLAQQYTWTINEGALTWTREASHCSTHAGAHGVDCVD